jgi:hypothetical protein
MLHTLRQSIAGFAAAQSGIDIPGAVEERKEWGSVASAGPLVHVIMASLRPLLLALEDKVVHIYLLGAALLHTVAQACAAITRNTSDEVDPALRRAVNLINSWSPEAVYVHPFPSDIDGIPLGQACVSSTGSDFGWKLDEDVSETLLAALLWGIATCAQHLGDSKVRWRDALLSFLVF